MTLANFPAEQTGINIGQKCLNSLIINIKKKNVVVIRLGTTMGVFIFQMSICNTPLEMRL